MREYNYAEVVKEGVLEYIKNEIDFSDFETIEELEEKLNDDLWTEDNITGNASGSYTFSTYQAEENLCHNLDLLKEACLELGSNAIDLLEQGAEACDVTIRCYLLSSAISEALEEIEEEFNKAHEEETE